MKSLISMLAFRLSALSVACMFSPVVVAASNDEHPLVDTAWQLVSFQSMDDSIGRILPEGAARYRMQLDANGQVSMQLDCNRGSGTWSSEAGVNGDSGSFTFGPLAMTRALCPDAGLGDRLARDAEYIRGFLLRDGQLNLSLMADGGIYQWAPVVELGGNRIVAAAPYAGGPRVWEVNVDSVLNMRMAADTGSQVVSRFSDGTLLDNLGCTHAQGRYWCDVQALGSGGARGYVAMEYLLPATAADGTIPQGEDDSPYRAATGDFDANGFLPCAGLAGQPMGSCEFAVARGGGGDATVVVTRADGSTRTIFFHFGLLLGADTAEADGYPEVSAEKDSDLFMIRVGEERYEVAEVVIYGD